MKICVIGAGIAGLTAAFQLADCRDIDVTVYEQDSRFGGRAAVDDNGEHCPRLFLDDYHELFDVLKQIKGRTGGSVFDDLRRVRRFTHVDGRWLEISHIYRFLAQEISLSDRIKMVRALRTSPLLAEQRRHHNNNRYASPRSYSLRPVFWLSRRLSRTMTSYALPGGTDQHLIEPWVSHLRDHGVVLHADERAKSIRVRDSGFSVRSSSGSADFDVIVVATFLPDLVNLLDNSAFDHTVADTAQLHCVAYTIGLDPKETIVSSAEPAFYSRDGVSVLVQPERSRCVVLCTRAQSTAPTDVVAKVGELLGLAHDVREVRMRPNLRPGEGLLVSAAIRPDRVLRRSMPGIYFAGSHIHSSYPIDSAEGATRSASNAVRAIVEDFHLRRSA